MKKVSWTYYNKQITLKTMLMFNLMIKKKVHSFLPLPFLRGEGGPFKQDFLVGGIFSKILVGEWGNKKGEFNVLSLFDGGNLLRLGNFFFMSCKNNLAILIQGHVQNKLSYSCFVMIDCHVIHVFYIFLLPLGSIASSDLHPIFAIDRMQKCEHKAKGKRFSIWRKESFLFLSQLFPEVGSALPRNFGKMTF